MPVKEQLYRLIDQLPAEQLPRALELIQQLSVPGPAESDEVWAAFLERLEKNDELYHLLSAERVTQSLFPVPL